MDEPSATVVQPVSVHRNSPSSEASERALSIRLGRATYQRKDMASLEPGSTLVLESLATEPVDIFVDGQLIARGEVLLVEGKYCVRICEVVGQSTPRPIGEVSG